MGKKTAVLRVRVEPELHKQFVDLCESMGMNSSDVLRKSVQAFVDRYKNDQQADMFQPIGLNENN